MRCKTCNYTLWQINPGPCPECGTPFKPSDYEFVVNSVRFCCPHCQQTYYGTGDKGHLVPPEFACVTCGQAVKMDEMVLLPTEGVSEEQTEVTVVPWVERRKRTWFGAFFSTMGLAMASPYKTIDGVPKDSSMRRALAYLGVHLTLQTILGAWFLLFIPFGIAGGAGMGGTGRVLGLIAMIVGLFLIMPAAALVWILITHAALRITGPAPGGLRRTVHALSYSAGNNMPSAIPCIGLYFFWAGALWWTISAGFMLAKGHGVKGWRAAVAVATPMVISLAILSGFVAWVVYESQQMSSRVIAGMPTSTAMGTTQTSLAGLAYVFANKAGEPLPNHMVELLMDYEAQPMNFLLPGSGSDGATAKVVGYKIDEWGVKGMSKHPAMTAALRVAWPKPGPVHRVGDWVFVYQGQDPDKPSSALWVAVGWPDPANATGEPVEVPVIFADGGTEVIPADKFDARLKEQNQERADAGLPTIAHPREVQALPGPSASDSSPSKPTGKDGEEIPQEDPPAESPKPNR